MAKRVIRIPSSRNVAINRNILGGQVSEGLGREKFGERKGGEGWMKRGKEYAHLLVNIQKSYRPQTHP